MGESVQTDDQRPDGDGEQKRRFPIWTWITIWVISGLLVAVLTLVALIVISLFLREGADRVAFVTGNMLNAWIVIAVIAQVVIYSKQWRVMERQWFEANRQARASAQVIELMVLNECPYVRVQDMYPVLPIRNYELIIRGKFFNGGKTPAWQLTRQIQVSVGTSPEPFSFDESPTASGVTSILANTDVNFDAPPVKVTNALIAELNNDKKWIFIDGECRYFDQLGGDMVYGFGFTFVLGEPPRALERYQYHRRKQTKPN